MILNFLEISFRPFAAFGGLLSYFSFLQVYRS
jgi:hypothetical protein